MLLVLTTPGAFAQAAGAASGDPQAAAPEEAKRAPITNIDGSAPAETPQDRLERFKREKGAGSDKPFEGFALQAEQEMERQRRPLPARLPRTRAARRVNPTTPRTR